MLSILLPTYNCDCTALVAELHRQCTACGAEFEILVADDGSPDRNYVSRNRAIERLEGVRYIVRNENVGRSAIRNFLISQARFSRLLFIDGDLSLRNPDFVKRYLQCNGDVVVGGIAIGGDENEWAGNLRYRYEKACEEAHNVANRQKHPNQYFRTTNFLASADVMRQCLFDERIAHYGYEDVLLGKAMAEKGVAITHIDNPITLSDYEPNDLFLSKTEEALSTLCTFQHLLTGYSHLLETARKISKAHLTPLFLIFYNMLGKTLRHHLEGNNPRVFWFNMYRLMYYIHIDNKNRNV